MSRAGSTGWFLYILSCADASLYVGTTTDLRRRLTEHRGAKGGAAYTRGRLPVHLRYVEPHGDRASAQRREAEIKRWSRARKLAFLQQMTPAPRRPGSWFCLFCAAPLKATRRGEVWRCVQCAARVRFSRNERDCVIELAVEDCGAGRACCGRRDRSADRVGA